MGQLPFNQSVLSWIASHRFEPLTSIFLFFTFIGGQYGYILIGLGMYWLYNKRIAIKISMVIATASILNHLLKITIRNPRPFVTDGTYQQKWGIPKSQMAATAKEYSTPSGHAMGAASFWSYFYTKFKSRKTLYLVGFLILMIGLSRPYLGVHYFEDIFLGWGIGFLVTFIIVKYEESFSKRWSTLSLSLQNLIVIGISTLSWLIAGLIADWSFNAQTLDTLVGLVNGLLVGSALEARYIKFDPKTKDYVHGIIKFVLGLVLSLGIFLGLDVAFAPLAEDNTFLGFLLRYIRYSLLGILATVVVGWVFLRLNLAEKEQ